MAKKKYSEKLKHPKWQRKRLEIMQRDGFKCKLCGDKESELHIHHEEYEGDPWDVDNKFLHTLCSECHDCLHSSPFVGSFKSVSAFKSKINKYNHRLVIFRIDENPECNMIVFVINNNINQIVTIIPIEKQTTHSIINLFLDK